MILLYIDPGTGALLINLIIAIGTTIVFYFKSLFFWLLNIKKSQKKIKNSTICIFSEGEKYWDTFKPIINSFIEKEIFFQYFTMSYKDPALLIENQFIESKYIGEGIFGYYRFSNIKSENLITTTPNIGNKKSPLKRPVNVKNMIHVYHSIVGTPHYRKGSLDNYDSVIVGGEYQINDIRKIEELRELKIKNIYRLGIPYLETLNKNKKIITENKKTVLIASSWGNKGCFKVYGTDFIDKLLIDDYNIILRPHPHSFINEKELILNIKSLYAKNKNVKWDESLSPSNSMNCSDILISDSSSIRFDFSFVYKKPVITLKIKSSDMVGFENQYINSDWEEKTEKLIGAVINKSEINNLNKVVMDLLARFDSKNINKLVDDTFYNFKNSGTEISKFFLKKDA